MAIPEPSRTRQYVQQLSQQRMNEHRIAGLEAELEEQERRNLRLSNQLLDEVALRARAERSRDDLQTELETLNQTLETADGPAPKEKPGKPTRKSRQPAKDRSTVSGDEGLVLPDERDASQPAKDDPKPKKGSRKSTSSRTRGSVK